MPRVAWLTLLCLLAYAPTLTIPLLEDDYPNLVQSLTYGTPGGQRALFADRVFRLRATSYWVMGLVWSHARLNPLPYHAVSLALHALAALLLMLIVLHWPPLRPAAFWAAAFFAVHEGHQEAVMWFSAINELLQFVFGAGALLCWCRAALDRRWHCLGVPLFCLALVSKESAAVVLLPLFCLVRPPALRLTQLAALLPYLILAALALVSIWTSRGVDSFRFTDGSFSLSAPVWITLSRGIFRLLWIWGLVALVYLALVRRLRSTWLVPCLAWITVSLLPYSFLTYSTAIPSRQTYLASAGLALLVGLAFARFRARTRRLAAVAVAATILLHNAGTIWTRKRRQFLERAAPTELLIETARAATSPFPVCNFPRSRLVAEEAVRLAVPQASGLLQWPDEAFCASAYRDRHGSPPGGRKRRATDHKLR